VTITSGNETVAVQSSTTTNVVESVAHNVTGVNTPLINVDLAGDPNTANVEFLFEDNTGVTANVQRFQIPNNQQTVQAIPPPWVGRPQNNVGSVRETWQTQSTAFPPSQVYFEPIYGLGGGSLNARVTQRAVTFSDANANGNRGPTKVFHTGAFGGPRVALEPIQASWHMTDAELDDLPPLVRALQNSHYNQISVGTSIVTKNMVACFNKAATAGVDGGTF